MVDFTAIKELLIPKTLNKLTYVMVVFWFVVGTTLCVVFSEMDISKSNDDIHCVAGNNPNIAFIRGKCSDQYRIQNHKLGFPPYLFVMVNVLLILLVPVFYSQIVKSTVDELERNPQDEEAQVQPRNRKRTLFIAYLCQLIISLVLEITFIALLETHLFYPKNFPSDFSCSIETPSFNRTQSTNIFNCSNQGAGYKNVWMKVVTAANVIFAISAFLEILCILSRGRHGKEFMENWRFHADHLKSNYGEQRPGTPEPTPSTPEPSEHPEHALAQTVLQSAIQTLRENYLRDTEKPTDLKQPFGRPNPGEGCCLDLKMDEIYVNVAIHEDRPHHYFAKDRQEQLKQYPPNAKDCKFVKAEDILDKRHKNVLVVGRPGIGKTSLTTKMGRLWASGEAFNEDENYKVVFLVKFRRFNDGAKLSLRELLAGAETVQRLDDSVWEFVQNESTKVLFIFDGLDEYSRKEEMNTQEDYKNNVEEKMPISVLYKKLAMGKLLRGASILATTRPTAVKYVKDVNFQRTVEILGFTSENVQDYVKNFTRGNPEAMEKMWEHIKSNINLFSFCYVPMNCFLICHCLLQIILSESSQALPTKMTEIYKITVKMLLFNHNREAFSPEKLEELKSTHMYEPFEKFPEEVQKILNSLGEIAFKGIEEGRLLFESSEVSGLEDCGLLHKLPDLKPKALGNPPKSQFCFTHLTVQEFFAAKHLVDRTKTNQEIEEFVWKYINNGTWQVVVQFAAGLLKSSLSTDLFIKLLPDSTEKRKNRESSEPKTLTSWPATKEDKDLAVQVCKCLYEINDENQQPVLQNKIEKIKFNAVNFSECSLAPIDVAAVLHFLENAEEVLYINLYRNRLEHFGVNEVQNFIVNRDSKLKWLNLGDNCMPENAVKDFAEALKHSNFKLKELQLNRNGLTDNAAKDFAAALQHSNCKLESLDLSYNEFTDNAAKDFAAALKHSNCKLKSLYLRSNFTDNAAKYLTAALEHSDCKLKSLTHNYTLTDNAAKYYAAALMHSNCKLESLNLSFNKFTDNAAKDFAAALKHGNCKLESLFLRENNLTDNAAKDLAEALKHSNCKLESLSLGYNNFTDNAAKDFAAALAHSNCKLKSLYLSENDFTDNAAKDFAAALAHSNCKLESLYLSGNKFTDTGAKDFAAALAHSNCKLESLYLSGNKFTDNAAKDFAAALAHSNCKLESLYLSRNKFTDNAAKDFTAALAHSNCKLEWLDLSGNKFTDNAAKDFATALKHSNCKLESLSLRDNNFTENTF